MTVVQRLKEKLEMRLGREIKTLSDCEALARKINENVCKSENAEAQFLISRHAIALIFGISDKSMFNPADCLDSRSLNKGERIHISYEPERDLILTYLGESRYIVNESVNSKLHKGDELYIEHLALGFEMIVSKVVRNGIDIGAYNSAKCGGLTVLEIV